MLNNQASNLTTKNQRRFNSNLSGMKQFLFSSILAITTLVSCAQKQKIKTMNDAKIDPSIQTETAYFGEG